MILTPLLIDVRYKSGTLILGFAPEAGTLDRSKSDVPGRNARSLGVSVGISRSYRCQVSGFIIVSPWPFGTECY